MTPLEKYNKEKKKKPRFFSVGYSIVIVLMFLVFGYSFAIFPLFLTVMLRGVIYKSKNNKYQQKISGLKGEAEAQKILSTFAKKYNFNLFSNITLHNKNAEMDFVLVGDNSINVIEVKNARGEFFGDKEDKYLDRTKISRQGEEYNSLYYNPIKQVKTHVYKLSELFKDNNINEWIDYKVIFLNPESFVYVEDNNIYNHNEIEYLRNDLLNLEKNKSKIKNKDDICQLLNIVGQKIV